MEAAAATHHLERQKNTISSQVVPGLVKQSLVTDTLGQSVLWI